LDAALYDTDSVDRLPRKVIKRTNSLFVDTMLKCLYSKIRLFLGYLSMSDIRIYLVLNATDT